MDYVKDYTGDEYNKDTNKYVRHTEAMNRCFYPSTVEEIMENLKKENTPFANQCLEQMKKNSMLSMKLALRMVRDARNLDYKGCLLNEINVSLNKIQDKEFDQGISEVLMKPGKSGASPAFSQDISADQLASYFEVNKFASAVELDVVAKAMLPTRFYYEKFSD